MGSCLSKRLSLWAPGWPQGGHRSSELWSRHFPDFAAIPKRKPPRERIIAKALATDFFLREEDSGCGTKDGELENFNCRFYFLKNFTAAQWAGSWVDTAVSES